MPIFFQKCIIFFLLSLVGIVSMKVYAAETDSLFIKKPHIVFLISKDTLNYEADKTIPLFAASLEKNYGFVTTVLQAEGERTAATFPHLGVTLKKADLMVVFARRLALPPEQMESIKTWFQKGKPMVGIRTANHAFSVAQTEKKNGYTDWWAFVPDILGCINNGYGAVEPGTDVSVVANQQHHEILNGLPEQWHSNGNLYLISDENNIVPLLTGTVAGGNEQPIAWTRSVNKSRVFYTSLGHPDDFSSIPFTTLLTNAVFWGLELKKTAHK